MTPPPGPSRIIGHTVGCRCLTRSWSSTGREARQSKVDTHMHRQSYGTHAQLSVHVGVTYTRSQTWACKHRCPSGGAHTPAVDTHIHTETHTNTHMSQNRFGLVSNQWGGMGKLQVLDSSRPRSQPLPLLASSVSFGKIT